MRYLRFLIATAAISACLCGHAQHSADTVAVFREVDSVAVYRSDNMLTVTAKGLPNDPAFSYKYEMEFSHAAPDVSFDFSTIFGSFSGKKAEKKTRKRSHFVPGDDIYIGAGIPVGDTPVKASVEVGLASMFEGNIRCGNVTFCAGAGIGYSQWALDGSKTLATEKGRLLIVDGEPGSTPYTSRIRTWRVHLPLMLYLGLGNSGYIGAGSWLNFNFSASAYTTCHNGSTTTRNTFKGLHSRAVTPDIVLTGGVKYAGLYLRYSPKPVFSGEFGPEFKTLSIGFITAF